jgi:hypothetical protein
MALISLLEITKIREFRITNGSVSLSDHASPITSGVPKSSRIALLEIDHSRDRVYLSFP